MPYLAPELLAILCDYLSKSDLLGFARVNKLFSAVARRRLHRLVPLRLSLGYKRPESPNLLIRPLLQRPGRPSAGWKSS